MKTTRLFHQTLFVAALAASYWQANANADTTASFTVNKLIPDGDLNGMSDTEFVPYSGPIGAISVNLNIAGRVGSGFNGDLYVSLSHGTGFSILLNRVGRIDDSTWSLGYGDNGMNVVFNDQAANGDIHNYRSTLSGNNATLLNGPLTGTWAPDGRNSDPTTVRASDSRTAFLNSFKGLNENGDWTICVIDASTGGTSQLVSWGLDILTPAEAALVGLNYSVVPEAARFGWIASLLAFGMSLFRPILVFTHFARKGHGLFSK